MKVKGKHVLLMVGFIILIAVIYLLASTFSYVTLSFSHFYKASVTTTNEEAFHISYALAKDDHIIFVEKDDDKYKVNKIKANNIDPVTVTSLNANEVNNYQLIVKGKYAYVFYNNNDNVKIIDYTYYKFNDLKDLPDGKTIINEFNDSLYSYNNYTLTKLVVDGDSYTLETSYSVDNEIKDIKNISFINENEVVISTYNSTIYKYNITENSKTLITDNYLNYEVYNNSIYYVYSFDSSHLGIGLYSDGQNKNFKVKACDYLSMQVVDNYIYLISENEIYKVNVTREKRHETLQISTYQNASFYLQDVLIVSEKLMYLPMVKYEQNTDTNQYEYAYYLYRYKR